MRIVAAILHLALHSFGSVEPGSPLVCTQLETWSKHPVYSCKVMDTDLASPFFWRLPFFGGLNLVGDTLVVSSFPSSLDSFLLSSPLRNTFLALAVDSEAKHISSTYVISTGMNSLKGSNPRPPLTCSME